MNFQLLRVVVVVRYQILLEYLKSTDLSVEDRRSCFVLRKNVIIVYLLKSCLINNGVVKQCYNVGKGWKRINVNCTLWFSVVLAECL